MMARMLIWPRIMLAVALPLIVVATLVATGIVNPEPAMASHDARCDDDVVRIDERSDTTLTPVGVRVVVTRASCSGASESNEEVTELRVTANVTGVEEYVVAVLRHVVFQKTGSSDSIRRIELHAPAPPNATVCVEFSGEKHCAPPHPDTTTSSAPTTSTTPTSSTTSSMITATPDKARPRPSRTATPGSTTSSALTTSTTPSSPATTSMITATPDRLGHLP